MRPDEVRTTTDRLLPLTDGLTCIGRPEDATLLLAAIRCLLMDLDATADADRTDRAFRAFLALLDGRGGDDRSAPETG